MLAEGRVWTGAQALERKLVDERGGILKAIARARELAGIGADEPVTVDVMTRPGDPVLDAVGLGASMFGAGTSVAAWRQAARLLVGDPSGAAFALTHEGRPLALLPAQLDVE